MRKIKQDTKKNVIRVIMFIMAIVMILSFVILPLTMDVAAEEDNTAVTVTELIQVLFPLPLKKQRTALTLTS